jgi:drug/metabolite transporter (DMT)-like permease
MQDFSWFLFSVLATLFFGVSMALYKLPFARHQKRFAVSFWQLLSCFVLSSVLFFPYLEQADWKVVSYGFLWGTAFFSLSVTQMKALKKVETNIVYPITTSISLVVTVLFGILFFRDYVSFFQIVGMALVIFVVWMFSYSGKKLNFSRDVVVIGVLIIFLSALGKIIQKFAADSVDIHALQIFQYLFAMTFAFLMCAYFFGKDLKKHIFSGAIKSGFLIGVPSFFGGYFWLLALERGPFSLITAIHSLYALITAVLAYFIFKEKLTMKKVGLIFLAIIAALLIKLG